MGADTSDLFLLPLLMKCMLPQLGQYFLDGLNLILIL